MSEDKETKTEDKGLFDTVKEKFSSTVDKVTKSDDKKEDKKDDKKSTKKSSKKKSTKKSSKTESTGKTTTTSASEVRVGDIPAEQQHDWKNKMPVTKKVFDLVTERGWCKAETKLSQTEQSLIKEIKFRIKQGRRVCVCNGGKIKSAMPK